MNIDNFISENFNLIALLTIGIGMFVIGILFIKMGLDILSSLK